MLVDTHTFEEYLEALREMQEERIIGKVIAITNQKARVGKTTTIVMVDSNIQRKELGTVP